MRVRIERRGGLIGRTASGERDIEKLSPAQREALDRIVRLPPDATPSPGADRFMYAIVLKNDDGSIKVVIKVPEDKMPDILASIPQIEL
jgi:Emfourin